MRLLNRLILANVAERRTVRRAHNRVVPEEAYSGTRLLHTRKENTRSARAWLFSSYIYFFNARMLVRFCLNESCLLTLDRNPDLQWLRQQAFLRLLSLVKRLTFPV